MTTITDIRNELINVFNKLRDGTMEAKEAVEINNTAGKIISSAKVQLAYAALRGEMPNIAFLKCESADASDGQAALSATEVPPPLPRSFFPETPRPRRESRVDTDQVTGERR